MSDSTGDGSFGTGSGGSHDTHPEIDAGHSHHIEHHRDDANVGSHLIVDLNTGTATFPAPRRIGDSETAAETDDEPTVR